jgi:hypothetical protein
MMPGERKVIYECKPGDRWCIWNHHLVIANPDHPPFMIELATGQRKEIDAQTILPPIE